MQQRLSSIAGIRLKRWMAISLVVLSSLNLAGAQSAPSDTITDPTQAILNYLLGLTSDATGLDRTGDSKVDAADLVWAIQHRPPTVTSFKIAGGAALTATRTVTLASTCSGVPAYYIACESPTFSGVAWHPYTGSASFTLSGGNVKKTVYYKVKSSVDVESPVVSASITLQEVGTLTVGAVPVTGTIAPAGDADWWQFTLAANSTYTVETFPGTLTDDYMRLFSADMTTLVAQDRNSGSAGTARVVQALAPGTYYAKIQAYNAATTGTYTIKVTDLGTLTVSSFKINGGATPANSRTVTLNNTSSVPAAYYMASESSSFSGANWLAYSTAPTFTLSDGNVSKTVYFKVKSSYNVVSPVVSATIALQELVPLTIGAAAVSGSISPAGEGDWYQFTVPSSSAFVVETFPGTLTDDTLRLYGPGNMTTLVAQDHNSGSAGTARVALTLAPGTYTANVTAYSSFATGTYGIKVNSLGALAINSFTINNDAATAYSRTVTLNSSCSGTPVQFMASESSSFSGASWQPYSAAASFTLSSGNASKKVYFKVKDLAGVITSPVSDKITLKEITPLATDGTLAAGTIASGTDENWYSFTVATAGLYSIQTYSGSLNDTIMGLAAVPEPGTNDWITIVDNISASDLMAQISVWLSPGTYYLRVIGANSALTGTYTIKVWQPVTTKLTLHTASAGYITASTDANWYQFTVPAEGTYKVETFSGTLTSGQLDLYDANGVRIGQNVSPDTSTMPGITAVLKTGTYLVRFTPTDASSIGTYSIRADSGPITDGVVSLVLDGATASGFLKNPALNGNVPDTNEYQLIINKGGTYSILTNNQTMSSGVVITLTDSSGYSSSSSGSLQAVMNAGIYKVTISAIYTTDFGSYQIVAVTD